MTTRRLTVVQLVPALQSGGAERSTLEVAQALVAAGHFSIVVSGGGRLVERLRAAGSEHVEMPIGEKKLGTLALVSRLRGLLKEFGADIVHARSRLPAWLGWRALRGLPVPRPHFVTTVHGLNSPGWYSGIMARGERVICVSNNVRDHVLRHYPRTDPSRLVLIPRGVDTDEFPFGYQPDDDWRQRFFAEFPQLAGAPLLTLPARGTRLKGHAHAIELLADLQARGVDARLLLLGAREPGREDYVDELEKLAIRFGISRRVVITPPRADVRDIMAISTLVLQMSTSPESFGRTVIEALALCRPVLGYAHGGVDELLTELYPAGRVAMGDRNRLAERAAELMRRAPAIQPLTRYRLADMQAATLALYQELAAEGRAAAD
ncbi:MAG TPA: glycosyltransferase [Dokdonella sp.]|uniref:glycosyltransferase n=1 Tax=Dokdonella sp. TaxID=2291710 RepID=UPI0025C31B37|nr:glycosyltransferase [Dokdonella sp.]MBX3690772.1 glycosyltransferase [Dokdonella sp.]MCW5568616.1 glycosyltransferase [Dokdonella sp.]HNR91540.1 glycosyltransferase [Dokdonella sp.]